MSDSLARMLPLGQRWSTLLSCSLKYKDQAENIRPILFLPLMGKVSVTLRPASDFPSVFNTAVKT